MGQESGNLLTCPCCGCLYAAEANAKHIPQQLFMVFDYYPYDLYGLNFFADLQTPHIKSFMRQLLEGIDYIHTQKNVLHRDIKCKPPGRI
jgi:serine/threonine protein kinase